MNLENNFMPIVNRILLFIMVLLAAYEVTAAGNSERVLATWAYTLGFGVLVVAGLILIILGNEVLEKSVVVIISTIIPLSISLGLVSDFFPQWQIAYLIFVAAGFVVILFTRLKTNPGLAAKFLAPVHGVAGLVIFLAPIWLVSNRIVPEKAFLWVSLGGALIGLAGLLLYFLRSGKVILSQKRIYTIIPLLLMMMMLFFVMGFQAV